MKNENKLPREAAAVLAQHVDALTGALGEKLVGVYAHGSAAMGGFNPRVSDLDYLALVSAPLSVEERAATARVLRDLFGKSGFAKGVEMSIIEARYAGADFHYPTPFEFHMGNRIEQLEGHAVPHEREYVDPDLASHFTVTRLRGVCVYGAEIADIFLPFDWKFFLKSNYEDIRGARELVATDPVYVILNLTRSLYAWEDHAVLSKAEGAERYLREGRPHRGVVAAALSSYRSGEPMALTSEESAAFIEEMLGHLRAPQPADFLIPDF